MNDFKYSMAAEAAGTTYSEVFDYSNIQGVSNVETTINVTTFANPGTLDITPQYSYDKETWFDHPTVFTQLATTGSETLELDTIALFMRFEIVVAGGSAAVTGEIFAVAK